MRFTASRLPNCARAVARCGDGGIAGRNGRARPTHQPASGAVATSPGHEGTARRAPRGRDAPDVPRASRSASPSFVIPARMLPGNLGTNPYQLGQNQLIELAR